MFKTNKQIDYSVPGNGLIAIIPTGTVCMLATNLPYDRNGNPQYWVAELPEQFKGHLIAESWHRNYGFLIAFEDVTKEGSYGPADVCPSCQYVHAPGESCVMEPES